MPARRTARPAPARARRCGSARSSRAGERDHRRRRRARRPRHGRGATSPSRRRRGIARTGVTAIVPPRPRRSSRQPVPAGAAVLNGAGEMTGFLAGRASGDCSRRRSTSPRRWPSGGSTTAPSTPRSRPTRGRRRRRRDPGRRRVRRQLAQRRRAPCRSRPRTRAGRSPRRAGGPVAEGARRRRHGHDLLRLEGRASARRAGSSPTSSAHRRRAGAGELRLGAATCASTACPSGRALGRTERPARAPAGSCIAVVATDAPLAAAQLERVARRAGLGLARTGSVAPPRQRRDLPRLLDRGPRGRGRSSAAARPTTAAGRDSIRSSPRPSTRPRRRC